MAIVDDDDFAGLAEHRWQPVVLHGRVHAVQRVAYLGGGKYHQRRKTLQMHRVILGVTDPLILVDHRDGNPLNNTRANLRSATRMQNGANLVGLASRKRQCGGFLGVSYCRRTQRWIAQLQRAGRRTWLGRHSSAEEAARARDAAALAVDGEFAALNFPIPKGHQ